MNKKSSPSCDRCRNEISSCIVSIKGPGDNQLSGMFCSITCAQFANRFINDPPRMIEGWKTRQPHINNSVAVDTKKKIK